uniref:Uncharacterized protein n=1 Tax=Mycena chlorophos TaxID=658473 RepID=A0ABQ0LLN7_MYCCL|nr:predicted protein [Mycena chlorophos]
MWFDLLKATLAGENDFEFNLPVVGTPSDRDNIEEDTFSGNGEDAKDEQGPREGKNTSPGSENASPEDTNLDVDMCPRLDG